MRQVCHNLGVTNGSKGGCDKWVQGGVTNGSKGCETQKKTTDQRWQEREGRAVAAGYERAKAEVKRLSLNHSDVSRASLLHAHLTSRLPRESLLDLGKCGGTRWEVCAGRDEGEVGEEAEMIAHERCFDLEPDAVHQRPPPPSLRAHLGDARAERCLQVGSWGAGVGCRWAGGWWWRHARESSNSLQPCRAEGSIP